MEVSVQAMHVSDNVYIVTDRHRLCLSFYDLPIGFWTMWCGFFFFVVLYKNIIMYCNISRDSSCALNLISTSLLQLYNVSMCKVCTMHLAICIYKMRYFYSRKSNFIQLVGVSFLSYNKSDNEIVLLSVIVNKKTYLTLIICIRFKGKHLDSFTLIAAIFVLVVSISYIGRGN